MTGSARVFISYSSKDTDIIDHLKAAVANAGIAVWLDHEQLTPGTSNWQVAVRNGIKQATHVVYAASETAALSPYVIQEIEMAKGEGKTVLPFWIRGEKWYDCTPMGWYPAQYTDGRGSAYASGLSKLLAALGVTEPAAPPSVSVRPPQPSYPLPDMPPQLVSLGYHAVNPYGTPAIVPPMVEVAAGTFLMGSDKTHDREAGENEAPQHRVELATFKIGKYPVTVAEYALAVRTRAVREPKPNTAGAALSWLPISGAAEMRVSWRQQLERPLHPAMCISWQDAQTYVTWLREATGDMGWRLPSEAEWEKAARWDPLTGASRIYPWGNVFDKRRCNTSDSGIKHTTSVDSYPANDTLRSGASPSGAEDMSGNVYEWTNSVFKPYPFVSTDGRETAVSTEYRVLRGGTFGNDSSVARASSRTPGWAGLSVTGFRLAWSASTGS